MILVDTSIYIEASEDAEVERLLEMLSQKSFVQSCDVIEKEIHKACEFLRGTGRKGESERLKAIYNKIRAGSIRTTERIANLAKQYQEAAIMSKEKHKEINNDFLIVAAASVAGVKNIFSFNRKTMASPALTVYTEVNARHNFRTPVFMTTKEELSGFLEPL